MHISNKSKRAVKICRNRLKFTFLKFSPQELSSEDVDFARLSWNLVESDLTPAFLDVKKNSRVLQPNSCIAWLFEW